MNPAPQPYKTAAACRATRFLPCRPPIPQITSLARAPGGPIVTSLARAPGGPIVTSLARAPSAPIVIAVEGIIGAGKTVLLAQLARALGGKYRVVVVAEPVAAWEASGALGLFYKDKKRYAYSFQTLVFATKMAAILDALAADARAANTLGTKQLSDDKASDDKASDDRACDGKACDGKACDIADARPLLVLIERSPLFDQVFAAVLQREGDLTDAEVRMRDCWFGDHRHLPIALRDARTVYLRPSLEVCMERLRRRDRASERSGVPAAYQRQLQEEADRLLLGADSNPLSADSDGARHGWGPSRVVTVESGLADQDFCEGGAVIDEVIRRLGL